MKFSVISWVAISAQCHEVATSASLVCSGLLTKCFLNVSRSFPTLITSSVCHWQPHLAFYLTSSAGLWWTLPFAKYLTQFRVDACLENNPQNANHLSTVCHLYSFSNLTLKFIPSGLHILFTHKLCLMLHPLVIWPPSDRSIESSPASWIHGLQAGFPHRVLSVYFPLYFQMILVYCFSFQSSLLLLLFIFEIYKHFEHVLWHQKTAGNRERATR